MSNLISSIILDRYFLVSTLINLFFANFIFFFNLFYLRTLIPKFFSFDPQNTAFWVLNLRNHLFPARIEKFSVAYILRFMYCSY
jgi:hypothetical protein